MHSIKRRIRQDANTIMSLFKNRPWAFYIGLFLVFAAIFMIVPFDTVDDESFAKISINNIPEFLGGRYKEWTSRLVIEATMITLLHLPKIIWASASAGCIVTIVALISYMLTGNKLKHKVFVSISIGLIPIAALSSAGWVATTLNYLFPAAAFLVASLPVYAMLKRKKVSKWLLPIIVIAAIFAGNQEQTAMLLAGEYLLALIYAIYNKKLLKHKTIWLVGLISLFSIVFILTAPGNQERSLIEAVHNWPGYLDFSIFDKVLLAVNGTMSQLILGGNPVFLVLIVLCWLYGFGCRKTSVKLASSVPIIFVAMIIFADKVSVFLPYIGKIQETMSLFSIQINDMQSIGKIKYLIFLVSIATILCVAYVVYNIGITREKNDKTKSMVMALIIMAGFASFMATVFSPQFYGSSSRTIIFLDIAFASVVAMLICENRARSRALRTSKSIIITVFICQCLSIPGSI